MCRGPDCFRDTFLILAALAAAALGLALVLWHRTRPLYVKVIAWTKTERSKRGLKARRLVWGSALCDLRDKCLLSVPAINGVQAAGTCRRVRGGPNRLECRATVT